MNKATHTQRLIELSEFCTRQVASVHGHLTAGEVEELDLLERIIGKQWDAVNGEWRPLDEEDEAS